MLCIMDGHLISKCEVRNLNMLSNTCFDENDFTTIALVPRNIDLKMFGFDCNKNLEL